MEITILQNNRSDFQTTGVGLQLYVVEKQCILGVVGCGLATASPVIDVCGLGVSCPSLWHS